MTGLAPTSRHAVFLRVWECLMSVPAKARETAIADLFAKAAAPRVQRESHRPLSLTELSRLSEAAVVGSHTVSHPALPKLSGEDEAWELATSRQRLQETLKISVTCLAYPFGAHDTRTQKAMLAAGYTLAFATNPEALAPETQLMSVPRLAVADCDGETFDRWLTECLGSLK
jgi:peptidoglycan/xylan/chitin deacetylase (PgdA/CDA1 family)